MGDCNAREVRVNTNAMPRCKRGLSLKSNLRHILCEIHHRDLGPQTKYPSPDCRLPSDLKPTTGLDFEPGAELPSVESSYIIGFFFADAGKFGRQALTVSLLDRLLFVPWLGGLVYVRDDCHL